MVHVLSRAFSARTLLTLVPRAAPGCAQAFLSHGFAAGLALAQHPANRLDHKKQLARQQGSSMFER
jgi:hypothetical protein